jgi:transketolase
MIATRAAYRDRLVRMMPRHPKLVCLDTDTGLFKADEFGPAAPRYFNLGIAEHNLMVMAAGMAASGYVPFVNTFATFAATRVAEAVKLDIAYNALPVRIAATHSGLSAGHFGPTHQALEDIAFMRTLPNMTVVVPADAAATEAFMEQSLGLPGPLYLRLGRQPTPSLESAQPPLIGRAQVLHEGSGGVLIVSCGPHPTLAALEAAHTLSATVLNMHTIKPLDTETLFRHAQDVSHVITIEEHWLAGGLGGAVAEALAEQQPVRVSRIGVSDTFVSVVGNHDQLVSHFGITAEAIVAKARSRPPRKDA